jgi:hypothetical protein
VERSAINSRGEALLQPSQRAFESLGRSEVSHDTTIRFTLGFVGIGAIIAVYALAVSMPIDPSAMATMSAYP